MNLYLRLLLIVIRGLRGERAGLLGELSTAFRVLPHDCDLNLHLNNARYLSFMDLSRIYVTAKSGLLLRLLGRGWLPVIDAQEISYLRQIAPGEKVEVVTELIGWTESHFFFKHQFRSKAGTAAVSYDRGLFVANRKIIPMKDVIRLVDSDLESPPLPEEVLAFHARAGSKRSRYRLMKNGVSRLRVVPQAARMENRAN